ncbi:hypothetical protein SmJEL517_g00298 [Synchytrium microbalum]|uniref:LIM zinc-binding domain-containing protein n=1 Tax=Synchytrium microbalum TaxID=1806994 RepID=A0A507CEK6_9FUNG|nr:uncharacterized protein SmJEL517_g00298 [Synchytrium microbalum]TPX38062.1 hypothetical protein SmJEL517_g00298 [Synchytrium microbalum]
MNNTLEQDKAAVASLPFHKLVKDQYNQAYIDVSVFAAGYLENPKRNVVKTTVNPEELVNMPSFVFLLRHPNGKEDLESYPPFCKKIVMPLYRITIEKDAPEILQGGGISPDDIDSIVYRRVFVLVNDSYTVRAMMTDPHSKHSHSHFDHTGDIYKFPKSKLYVGVGSKAHTAEAWPNNPNGFHRADGINLTDGRDSIEVKMQPVPFGPFETSYDFFGDGSFYLVDARGHCPGHLCGVVRVAANQFIFLGGDCCHHRDVFMKLNQFGSLLLNGRELGVHHNIEDAWQTLLKVNRLHLEPNVTILIAHDPYLVTEGSSSSAPATSRRSSGQQQQQQAFSGGSLRLSSKELKRMSLQFEQEPTTPSGRKQVRFDVLDSKQPSQGRTHWLDELQERKGDVMKWLEDVGTKRKETITQTAQASKNWLKAFSKRKEESPKSPKTPYGKHRDCTICALPIDNIEDLVQTAGSAYHAFCVVCKDCKVPVHPNQFVEGPDGTPILLCETDYQNRLKAITAAKSPSKTSNVLTREKDLVFCEGCRRPITSDPVEVEEEGSKTIGCWHGYCVKLANAWEIRSITYVPVPRGVNWRKGDDAILWEERLGEVFTAVDSFEASVFKTCSRLSRFLDRSILDQAERYGTRLVRRLDRLFKLLDEMGNETDLAAYFSEYESSRHLVKEFVSNYLNFMGALHEYPEHVDREYMQIIAQSARHTAQSVRLLIRSVIVWFLQLDLHDDSLASHISTLKGLAPTSPVVADEFERRDSRRLSIDSTATGASIMSTISDMHTLKRNTPLTGSAPALRVRRSTADMDFDIIPDVPALPSDYLEKKMRRSSSFSVASAPSAMKRSHSPTPPVESRSRSSLDARKGLDKSVSYDELRSSAAAAHVPAMHRIMSEEIVLVSKPKKKTSPTSSPQSSPRSSIIQMPAIEEHTPNSLTSKVSSQSLTDSAVALSEGSPELRPYVTVEEAVESPQSGSIASSTHSAVNNNTSPVGTMNMSSSAISPVTSSPNSIVASPKMLPASAIDLMSLWGPNDDVMPKSIVMTPSLLDAGATKNTVAAGPQANIPAKNEITNPSSINSSPGIMSSEEAITLSIDELVLLAARNLRRPDTKAGEWANVLKSHDIMTAGDLDYLEEEDWDRLGLSLLAIRAIRKARQQLGTGASSTASAFSM